MSEGVERNRIRLNVGKGMLDLLVKADEFDSRKTGFLGPAKYPTGCWPSTESSSVWRPPAPSAANCCSVVVVVGRVGTTSSRRVRRWARGRARLRVGVWSVGGPGILG